jgi:predicted nucleic-acid-binding protein
LIGLDTNILIRYIVQDERKQSNLAADFSDYLIAVLNRFADCEYTITFDKTAADFKYFKSLVKIQK